MNPALSRVKVRVSLKKLPVSLSKWILKHAGLSDRDREILFEVQGGQIILRPVPTVPNRNHESFEEALHHVLTNRRELLERLAK